MDALTVQQILFDAFNQARAARSLAELGDADDLNADISSLQQKDATYLLHLPEDAPEDMASWVEDQMSQVTAEGAGAQSEEIQSFQEVIFSKCTHISVQVSWDEAEVQVTVVGYFFYLRLEALGPLIQGDVIIQGTQTTSMGPALCIVEYYDGDWKELTAIGADKMIILAEDEAVSFTIPIHIEPLSTEEAPDAVPLIPSTLRMRIFVAEGVDYDSSAPINREGLLLAATVAPEGVVNSIMPTMEDAAGVDAIDGVEQMSAEHPEAAEAEDAEGMALDALQPADGGRTSPVEEVSVISRTPSARYDEVLQEIHIATDYDDIVALQSEGYDLQCLQVTSDGINNDSEFLWKFHIMSRYSTNTAGIEDIQWIKCLKSLGTLPTLPFYTIIHDYDLSSPDDDYSVYLAYRMGPVGRYKKLLMLAATADCESRLAAYVKSQKGTWVEAPEGVDKGVQGICGLMLVPTIGSAAGGTADAAMEDISVISDHKPQGIDLERDDDESSEDSYQDEEDTLQALQQQLHDCENEKASLISLHSELQKKSLLLIAREKALQGTLPGRTADIDTVDSSAEQSIEKEKLFLDILNAIVVERSKLNKQLKEFDQLALDLQTRLDDKEFKAKGISSSFKQFKQEILSKAQNSRTGHHLTDKQIQAIEQMEAKYEEELEKVRLRNISLRTSHKKLERTLRAREQLAEGLHMIDFEQLKIENQTLNEKIEERNEDLSKLKRKKTTTVQVLTHTREKLRFVEQANRGLQEKLNTLENALTQLRNTVTILKLDRDAIRAENTELKAKQSFATSDLLLSDYESRKGQVEQMDAAVEELKHRYQILVRQVEGSTTKSGSGSMPWLGHK